MAKALISFLVTLGTDWLVKSLPKGDWWVPHYVHRSLLLLPVAVITVLLVIALIDKRSSYIAGGLALGGFVGNIIDLSTDGVVWNMIPIPGTNGFTCNVADFAIVGGILWLIPAVVLHTWRWTKEVPAEHLTPSDSTGMVLPNE